MMRLTVTLVDFVMASGALMVTVPFWAPGIRSATSTEMTRVERKPGNTAPLEGARRIHLVPAVAAVKESSAPVVVRFVETGRGAGSPRR